MLRVGEGTERLEGAPRVSISGRRHSSSPRAYRALGIATVRSASILLAETRSGRLTALTNAVAYGVRYSRCVRADLVRPRRRGGVVAGLHRPPARFRVRRRRDRARRPEGAPPPPPRRDGRGRSLASQGGAVASGSGEVARRRQRGERATASRGALAGTRSLTRSASLVFDGDSPPGYP